MMDGLANAPEVMACPHCGVDIRRGMIRCRDCGQSVVETEVEFELTGTELIESQDPRCGLCGATLEPGSDDCAACTSALLDQLLKGPERSAPVSRSLPGSPMARLRVKRAAAARSNPVGRQSQPKPAVVAPRTPQAKPAKARSKASPAYPQPAVRKKDPPQYAAQAAVAPPAFTPPEEEAESATTAVETSAACTALLASLAKADATLRCEIATALGKLGDQEAVLPLERHLGDQDIRVRRAVAGALVLLGHPKGNTLLDIAERTPAASMLMMAKPIPKAKSYSGGSSIDSETLKKVGGAIVALGVVAGGIWFWMNTTPSKSKKGKAAAKKVVKPAAPAAPAINANPGD
jgi:nucleotide-binding universal stress UspA family protein